MNDFFVNKNKRPVLCPRRLCQPSDRWGGSPKISYKKRIFFGSKAVKKNKNSLAGVAGARGIRFLGEGGEENRNAGIDLGGSDGGRQQRRKDKRFVASRY